MTATDARSPARGWPLRVLENDVIRVVVNPARGAEILSIQRLSDNLDLLWRTPWGLRTFGAPSAGGGPEELLMEQYSGGWQTVFPHGGPPTSRYGATWGMHGETWLTPFEELSESPNLLHLAARLVRTPFRIDKCIRLDGGSVSVVETVTNEGSVPLEVMWGQHPVFGPPLLSPHATLEISGADVIGDHERADISDLPAGMLGQWPTVRGLGQSEGVDLREVPAPTSGTSRLLYLSNLSAPRVRLANPVHDIAVTLAWDGDVMPHLWCWLEAGGTRSFPWFGNSYALGLEPFTGFPVQPDLPESMQPSPLTIAAAASASATCTLAVTGYVPPSRSATS